MSDDKSRLFAIVPAAGLSRRMGTSKLLLPLGKSTVIERMLSSLVHPSIVQVFVVVRRTDDELKKLVESSGASCISPEIDPPDMKASVEFGLNEIRRRYEMRDTDGWILCPADHPVLDPTLVDQLINRWIQSPAKILVPRCGARRGHPTIFRSTLIKEVRSIPGDRGIDWLLRTYSTEVEEFATDSQTVLTDLDTPADYERLKSSQAGEV